MDQQATACPVQVLSPCGLPKLLSPLDEVFRQHWTIGVGTRLSRLIMSVLVLCITSWVLRGPQPFDGDPCREIKLRGFLTGYRLDGELLSAYTDSSSVRPIYIAALVSRSNTTVTSASFLSALYAPCTIISFTMSIRLNVPGLALVVACIALAVSAVSVPLAPRQSDSPPQSGGGRICAATATMVNGTCVGV